MAMTYDEARDLLTREGWLSPDGDIYDGAQYIDCSLRTRGLGYVLDGTFDLVQLEAIVVYMRHNEAPPNYNSTER